MTMKPSQDMATIDVAQVIDQRPLSSLQILVLFLAGLTIVLDGLDIQAVAFAAPAIAADLGLERASLGPIFSAGLLGMALGSMLMGPVADRYGRRFSVLLSVSLFGGFTFLTAFASSSTELLVFRFLTGLGLGGALPSLVVLVGEYSPKRIRAICAGVVLAGVPVGGLLGGLLATWAIPRFGWPSIFLIGGGLPVLMLPLLWLKLPESIRFMVSRGASGSARVREVMRRIDPQGDYGASAVFAEAQAPAEDVPRGVPIRKLFSDGMARDTVLLWAAFFTNLMGIYFLISWIPTLLVDAGYSIAKATSASVALNFGGVFGLVGLGWIVNRFGVPVRYVIAAALLIGSVHVTLVGVLATNLTLMLSAVFVAGAFVMGTQGQLFNLGSSLYPTEVRTTGLGWAVGIGRIGSVLGPLVGGALILIGLGIPVYFGFFGALLLLGAVAVLCMRREPKIATPAAGGADSPCPDHPVHTSGGRHPP